MAFPWIPAVSKVDGIENTIRWRMMVSNMPLSLLIITVGVHQKVVTVSITYYYCLLYIVDIEDAQEAVPIHSETREQKSVT